MIDVKKLERELERYTKTMDSLKPVPFHLHEAINTGMATTCVEVLRILMRSMEDTIDGIADSTENQGEVSDNTEGNESTSSASKRKPSGRGRIPSKGSSGDKAA